MSAIILIPAIFSCWIVARRSAAAAFFDVWLPCLMLLPLYFYFRPKHFPPLLFTDLAALPIFVVIIAVYLKRWDWRVMDGLILALVGLTFVAEARHTGVAVGGLELFGAISGTLFPYAAGRLFLEQRGGRKKFLQRFLVMLSIVSVISVWDFVSGQSLYQRLWSPLFPGQIIGWPVQMRWGFGRIAGPYAQSIIAGMMFLLGILLATGMRHFAPDWGRRRVFSFMPLTVRTLITFLLAAGLLMTQSRGPVFGALVGLAVIQIARAYNLKRASMVVSVILVLSLVVGYKYIQEYSAGDLTDATTLEQQNAIYRAHLLSAYSQIIHDGGMLGWGASDYPKAVGQDSIDNQYLLLLVTQGYLGLAVFLCICLGTFWTLIRMLPFATATQDRWLIFTLISIFVGVLLTLTTVFLGTQMYQMFFLLVGWVQALRTPVMARLQAERRSPAPMIKVYT
jgi:hypothetical protein